MNPPVVVIPFRQEIGIFTHNQFHEFKISDADLNRIKNKQASEQEKSILKENEKKSMRDEIRQHKQFLNGIKQKYKKK